MKRLSCILFSLVSLTFWGGNAMADDDPIICSVEINYQGKDYGGHDKGDTNEEALHDAKEEACERACRDVDTCERTCMETAVVKNYECKGNPKVKNPKDEYECRVGIRYNNMDYVAIDDDHNMDKAIRDAVEEACEHACFDQDKPKKCEHSCRINAEITGTECFDQNDSIVLNKGQLPPRPAYFHSNTVQSNR